MGARRVRPRHHLAPLALTLLIGCGSRDQPGASRPEHDAPVVLFAGCRELLADGTCVTVDPTTTLRLWVDQADFGRLRVQVDGRDVPFVQLPMRGGSQLELELDESATELTLRGVDPPWSSSWGLALAHEPHPAIEAQARQLVAQAGVEPAIAWIEAQLPSLPDRSRLAALQQLHGLAMRLDRVREAADRSAEIVALARRMGRLRAAARAANTAVYLYAYQLGELERAPPFLDALAELSASLPEARIWAGFSDGIVAIRAGDFSRAVQSFAASATAAERLGMDDDLLVAREGLAVTYTELGRTDDAQRFSRQLLDSARTADRSCSLRFAALNTAGWIQLDLAQRELEDTPPSGLFEEALVLVEEGGECESWSNEVDIRISLALTALADDDPAMSLAWLEPVDTVLPSLEPWMQEVRARAGLALGRLELVPDLVVGPSPQLSRGMRYNALMTQAAARQYLGLHEAAIDAYAEAEDVVDEVVEAIGIDLGRELFLSGRQQSALSLVEALVAAGRPAQALCRARRARVRALRLLDRTARLGAASPSLRAAWMAEVSQIARLQGELDAEAADDRKYSDEDVERRREGRAERQRHARRRLDEAYRRLGGSVTATDCADLPVIGAHETMIVVLPLRERWAVFVATSQAVDARLVAPLADGDDRGAWARRALAGAEAQIDGALRLRILPIGRSWTVDFHALPWRDGVLGDVAPLEYSLDLLPREDGPAEPHAAVISDPARDLPLARREADAVQGALERVGWSVDRLDGDDASYERVVATLTGATLLHYAGHGEHGGVAGWSARMRIGDGNGIGVAEILALPAVPRTVVLSGCETGRVSAETLEGGMSLARAFVLAGSRWVIASDRRVPDALALDLGRALYDAPGIAAGDPAAALQHAQQLLRPTHSDWAAFRLIVP